MMSVFKKLLFLCVAFLMVFSIAACGTAQEDSDAAEDSSSQTDTEKLSARESAPEGWTVLVYMCGSDLESDGGCASSDIYEMLDSEYSDDVRLVVQTGGATSWESEVDPDAINRYVRLEDSLNLADSQPDADMGDVETLESFLEWGVSNYPSEHMGLVFWNHGGGSIAGVCFDEKNDYDSLSVNDINTALESVAEVSGKFDFVGFDACLMSTLETANMLVPYADYMYASEETEPGTGWDYEAFFNYLAENPDANGEELGSAQCESYYSSTQVYEEDPSVTFSITDLSKIEDLVSAFDATCKELSECSDYAPIARGIYKADNFGGNNRTEGYTNMVDLADMLRNVSEYAPSAEEALQALDSAELYVQNGLMHENAGGLSLYYPLCIQGSQEISIFRDICPSTYYYAMVAKVAENADLSVSSEPSGFGDIAESDTLDVLDSYLDDNGSYTVELSNMDEFAYGSCSVYMDDGEGGLIYIGEDDDVIVDYDQYIIQDDFDGTWVWLDGLHLLPIQLVSRDENMSLYVCTVLRNGEETYLQIAYDWNEGGFEILGTWDGVNDETGMSSRAAEPLEDGDIINLVYGYIDADGEYTTFTGADIEVNGEMQIYYDTLTEGDYYYAINLYDIYGNAYQLDFTVFHVNADGSVTFTRT